MRFILHKFCRIVFGTLTHNENIDKDASHITGYDQAAEQYPHYRCSDTDEYAHEVEHQYFYRNKEQEENSKAEDKSLFLHEIRKEREHETHRTPGA